MELFMQGVTPREKMARAGISALNDAELLAILLGTGAAQLSATEMAGTLLLGFGGLRGLLLAEQSTLLV